MIKSINILFIIFSFPLLQVMFADSYLHTSPTEDYEPVRIVKRDSVLYVQRILILGDSHLLGNFGEMLQKGIHETGHFDILSIAIGGAGSRNFTLPMRNLCCGYAIRETLYNETLTSAAKIRKIEGNDNLTGELIGKNYRGKLQEVVERFDPNIVVIALGHNNINDHQNLINIIHAQNNSSKIIWVAPFRNRSIQNQLSAIMQVVSKNNLHLIRSDDILGSDSDACVHFYGWAAHNWALKVVQRMEPYIISASPVSEMRQKKVYEGYQEAFTVLSRYGEDKLFADFLNDGPTVFQALTGLMKTEYRFFPRYLNRTFAGEQIQKRNVEVVKDIDGNVYRTIQVGNTAWMAEDLRTTRFRNGEAIQKSDYVQKPSGDDMVFAANRISADEYRGKSNLYFSWHTVSNPKGICPDGWHIPDFSDWKYLAHNLDQPAVFFKAPSSWINSDGRIIEESSSAFFWTLEKVNDQTRSSWVGGFDKRSRSFILLNRTRNTYFPVRCVKD